MKKKIFFGNWLPLFWDADILDMKRTFIAFNEYKRFYFFEKVTLTWKTCILTSGDIIHDCLQECDKAS